jgi:hypothetical protein
MWPTPCAREAKGLPGLPGLPDVMTSTDGDNGSTKADLNPSFVAALMGLPPDWLTHSTSAETDSSPNVLPKQSDS